MATAREVDLLMWLMRRLPAEMAHNLALLSLRSGLWRIAMVIDGLITLSWAAPMAWLKRKAEARIPSEAPPEPGELWRLQSTDQSPWPAREHPSVKILDVRDGWVRYYINTIFPDERMELPKFLLRYRRHQAVDSGKIG